MENSEVNVIFRKKLLKTFNFIQEFFEKHNIKYYACGGTALGAVRHNGLIPWDDDIDIYVPREDYDRLCVLNDELNKHGYNFVCFENNREYYLPFGKIEDRKTTLWEMKRFSYITGVYVDIFPLDFYSGTKEDVIKEQNRFYGIFRNYQRSLESEPISSILSLLVHGHILTACDYLQSYFYHPFKNVLYKRLMREIEATRLRKGEWCVCTPQWRGKIFESEWFKNAKDMVFENTKIKIPSNYDAYLSLLYGDYMTPPPLKDRLFAHDAYRYYLNLKEHVVYKDIKKRMAKGEKIVY